jgi:molecular chaperone HtpG
MTQTVQRHEFQAETRELLHLMIHAIYSNKDIFLRELISNSSDAIDKLRFEALTNTSLPQDVPGEIRIEADKEARTLTLHDNGIGMDDTDLVQLIGTVAKSGTKAFIKAAKESNGQLAPELIGQFGVGFYATFMVAEKVEIISRKAGQTQAFKWTSEGDGAYTIEPATRANHGTSIILQLKATDEEDGLQDYTSQWVLRQIVKQYSDFVAYPIIMAVEKQATDKEEAPEIIDETLNSMKAIWTRPENEVSAEEYTEFYKHVSNDWSEPLETIRFKMEGTFEAQALLYLPAKAPMDLFYRDAKKGVRLYAKRVFIMEDCQVLLPTYLRFVKGVVDSEDLSLNISREILQQDRHIQAIKKRLVKKVLSTLDALKTDAPERYLTFWTEFGAVLKEGLFEDYENRESLLKLVFFNTTAQQNSTFADYVSRMKAEQKEIYYLTGDNNALIQQSPHLEAFKAKEIEVLLLTDPVDEMWLQNVFEVEGYRLKSVIKGEVDLSSEAEKTEAKETRQEQEKTYTPLIEALNKHLAEYIQEVRVSNRLTDSPVCLVAGENDLSPHMEQMLKSMNQAVPSSKRILEINPTHPLIIKLNTNPQEETTMKDYAALLYGQALMAEGSMLPDSVGYSQLVSKLLTQIL